MMSPEIDSLASRIRPGNAFSGVFGPSLLVVSSSRETMGHFYNNLYVLTALLHILTIYYLLLCICCAASETREDTPKIWAETRNKVIIIII